MSSATSTSSSLPARPERWFTVEKQEFLLRVTILCFIYILGTISHLILTQSHLDSAFSCRLFSVLRYESIIHEFDPWFNFRTTRTLVTEGLYNFINWFDTYSWYPLGRIVGGTVYPGAI